MCRGLAATLEHPGQCHASHLIFFFILLIFRQALPAHLIEPAHRVHVHGVHAALVLRGDAHREVNPSN